MEDMTMRFLEDMADAEHEKWASWMLYLFSQSAEQINGDVVIPKFKVDRWKRQCKTPYVELSESEKQSDRDVVIEFFREPILNSTGIDIVEPETP